MCRDRVMRNARVHLKVRAETWLKMRRPFEGCSLGPSLGALQDPHQRPVLSEYPALNCVDYSGRGRRGMMLSGIEQNKLNKVREAAAGMLRVGSPKH